MKVYNTAILIMAFTFCAITHIAAQTAPASLTSKPLIEPHAMALLKQNQDAMFHLRSFQATCQTTITSADSSATGADGILELAVLKAEKPNKMRYEMWRISDVPRNGMYARPAGKADTIYACDGHIVLRQIGDSLRQDENVGPNYLSTGSEPWRGFYVPAVSAYGAALTAQQNDELREVRIDGTEPVEGVTCTKILVHTMRKYDEGLLHDRATWYLSSDHIIRRCVASVSYGDKPGPTRDSVLSKIVLNGAIDEQQFACSPRAPAASAGSTHTAAHHSGHAAPDFTVLTSDHRSVKLSDYHGKVVVLDFFASWCGTCMNSMPHNQAVMAKLKQAGLPVVFLGVDDGEERPQFDEWIASRAAQFPSLSFAHASPGTVSAQLYGVHSIPNQFVVDKNGDVCAHFVGFGGPSDELETAVRAALKQ